MAVKILVDVTVPVNGGGPSYETQSLWWTEALLHDVTGDTEADWKEGNLGSREMFVL